MSRTFCSAVTSRWCWTHNYKHKTTGKRTCIWQRTEYWVWGFTVKWTPSTHWNTCQMQWPLQTRWKHTSSWWTNAGGGLTAVYLRFCTFSTTTISTWCNPTTTAGVGMWHLTYQCSWRCYHLSQVISHLLFTGSSCTSLSFRSMLATSTSRLQLLLSVSFTSSWSWLRLLARWLESCGRRMPRKYLTVSASSR